MNVLTAWLRAFLPTLPVSDRQLAEDLTLRGIAVEGVHPLGPPTIAGQPTPGAPANGHLFEMDITTNRVDAMNHYGIAREAATIYALPLAPLLPAGIPPLANGPAPLPIRIAPAAAPFCGRFTAQVLRDITVAPSTGEVARFLSLLGQRQISGPVDASNATLLGMGHPTHAFDLDKIEGSIVVRLAHPGETLQLLDGTTRTLEPDDLVIADEHKALSLAGVMGGLSSSITPATRNILVESAWFDPASIRRSSRRHLLHTDASHRFERGADFNAAPIANRLVSDLILATGGRPEGALIDLINPAAAARTAARPPITLRVHAVQQHLGRTVDDQPGHSALTRDLIAQFLTALGCTLHPTTPDTFAATLPSWRLDLEREVDLIEEVARVFGYNRFQNTLPSPMPVTVAPHAAAERAIRARLLALGFSESISSTFTSADEAARLTPTPAGEAPTRTAVPLENPLSEEASVLRPSLLPGMLGMLAGNLHRDVRTVRLFEQGSIFHTPDNAGTVLSTPALALGLTTDTPAATALFPADAAPVYELKGVLESLATLFELPGDPASLSLRTTGVPAALEPGRSAVALLHGTPIAVFGELAHAEQLRQKLRQRVFLAEIDLAALLALPLRRATSTELSRFQAVERDFSFLFPDSVAWHTLSSTITALSLSDLQRIEPIEIFRDPKGKSVEQGRYSVLLRTVFQSSTRTLTEADLSDSSTRIIAALVAAGGQHRA